jgi:SAM-dependent methyltransferase
MTALLSRGRAEALGLLERVTDPSRQRYAISLFMVGQPALSDRLAASLYYFLAAPRWSGYGDTRSHSAPLLDGLTSCRTARRALDIGTGAGPSAALVADRDPATEVTAVDTSRRMLRQARSRYPRPNLSFKHATSIRLPFPAASFDLVTSMNAVPVLDELRRVCTDDAEVLTASTTYPVRDNLSAWVGRWHEAGFVRVRTGSVGSGSWEVFTPR